MYATSVQPRSLKTSPFEPADASKKILAYLRGTGFNVDSFVRPFDWEPVWGVTQSTVNGFVVSPLTAAQLLFCSNGNPRGNESQVSIDILVRMMQGRDWIENHHQGLACNKHAVLTDGHTRMKSIIESGATKRFQITFNTEPDADAKATDQGTLRPHEAVLKSMGHAGMNKTRIATAKRIEFRDMLRIPRTGLIEERDMCLKHAPLVAMGHDLIGEVKRVGNAGVRAAVARAIGACSSSGALIEDFCYTLTTKFESRDNDPAIKLRNWLEAAKTAFNSNNHFEIYRKTELAIEAYLAGGVIHKWGSGYGAWKGEVFPLPGEQGTAA